MFTVSNRSDCCCLLAPSSSSDWLSSSEDGGSGMSALKYDWSVLEAGFTAFSNLAGLKNSTTVIKLCFLENDFEELVELSKLCYIHYSQVFFRFINNTSIGQKQINFSPISH